jgi:Na+-transporting methylmalonyl-CoA/oxaloacetate decarboxylase gamma subunit
MPPTAIALQLTAVVSAEQTSRAVDIAVTGMLMVFMALALLTVFLTLLPRVLTWLHAVWPESGDRQAALAGADALLGDEDDVLAAIGFVLHAESQERP